MIKQPLRLLTIAGSDSGGAAGLQADLKTWAALGVYGMSAITAVTAQNSVAVEAVEFLSAGFVAAQIDAVLSDYGAAAIKTGFAGRVDLIEVVGDRLADWTGHKAGEGGQDARHHEGAAIVVDPVLVNHRGEPMFSAEVVAAYRTHLLPVAGLITPNWHEAALLAGRPLPAKLDSAAWPELIAAIGARRVLVTGIRDSDEIVDLFWDGRMLERLRYERVETENLHGSGDTLSAAICAYVARGAGWLEAVVQAQAFTAAAIRRGAGWRLGAGHGPLGHAPHHNP